MRIVMNVLIFVAVTCIMLCYTFQRLHEFNTRVHTALQPAGNASHYEHTVIQ